MAGKLDAHDLHAQAQPEVGYGMLASIMGSTNLAFYAAIAKASGHYDAVDGSQLIKIAALLQFFGTDPGNVDIPPYRQAGVDERFLHAQVGILQLYVLAHQADAQDRFLT